MNDVYPVILSGGAGTRLWPMSRAHYPKQLLPLVGERTMLQDTVLRMHGNPLSNKPIIIANSEHRFIIADQLRTIEVEPEAIVLEPIGRNTAPAAAVAAMRIVEHDPDGIMVLLPSDHVVLEQQAFMADLEKAVSMARQGHLVAFGIVPDRPETGYGYIRRGAAVNGVADGFEIAEFVEKPDVETAERYVASGDYTWNSGMFVFSARRFLDELEAFQPEIVARCRESLDKSQQDLDFLRLEETAFEACPSNSIDVAVMEHTEHAAVVMASFVWSDVGAWASLWGISDQDEDGNVVVGDTLLKDVRNSYIRSQGHQLVSAIGVDDLVIVSTDDAVMVAPKSRAAESKDLVQMLTAVERSEAVHHPCVHRPWGTYQEIDQEHRFRVKRIVVKSGASLSLQKHAHRSEHWVVVKGRALITRGEERLELKENESTYIPCGMLHRLENPSDEELHLIEVQVGDYLGEDDIIRIEDHYGRS